MTTQKPLSSRFAKTPWVLLMVPILIWSGNVVAAKAGVSDISPMMLTTLRWFIVFASIFAWSRSAVPRALAEVRPHWRYVLIMGLTGFTAANSMFFLGARYTSGVNIAIIPGVMPAMVLIGMWVVYGVRGTPLRALGAVVTILGVAIVATRGDLSAITRLELNRGDVFQLVGTALYASFTLGMRKRPPLSAFSFFIGLAFAALLTSLPLLGIEMALGASKFPGMRGFLALLYVSVLTSIIGHSLWIRAIDAIGASRAGIFQNLVPVIGAGLAVLLLGEPFEWFHAVSLGLVLGGIFISEKLGR